MKVISRLFFALVIAFALSNCASEQGRLPYIGPIDVVNGDTIYHTIPDFRFIDQDSQWITNETFADQIYVSDFFFTSCPSICPRVKKQMLRIYDRYENEKGLSIISHSIDTKRDSVPVLKVYSNKIGVTSDVWHFVTGDKDEILGIANDYFVAAMEDEGAPGGFDHSGRLILVDRERKVRAFCDGTNPEEVDIFMKDIDRLLATY